MKTYIPNFHRKVSYTGKNTMYGVQACFKNKVTKFNLLSQKTSCELSMAFVRTLLTQRLVVGYPFEILGVLSKHMILQFLYPTTARGPCNLQVTLISRLSKLIRLLAKIFLENNHSFTFKNVLQRRKMHYFTQQLMIHEQQIDSLRSY